MLKILRRGYVPPWIQVKKCMPMRKFANLPFGHWQRYSAHVEVSRPTRPRITESESLPLAHDALKIYGRVFERFLYNELELVWSKKNSSAYVSDTKIFLAYFFSYFFVPTPLEGGRNYILKWVFFVQSILADRYIHRRELRLVSLESLSSVEHGIKKIFLIFVFYRELSRFKLSTK